jgi:hypothetical protein
MAAISHVFTIRRAAQILGRDGGCWTSSSPKDGTLWVYDIDDVEIPAFTSFGMENLREIIADQVDKAR